jgi:GNAT superfamily N-acetyltransferase
MIERLKFSTREAVLSDLSAIQAAARAQAAHWRTHDARLPRTLTLPRWVIFPDGGMCWLVQDGARPVGAVGVLREVWGEDSPFANVFPRQYVRLRLILVNGVEPHAALETCLECAAGWRGAFGVPGRMLTLPACAGEWAAVLKAAGFSPYHVIAHRPVDPMPQAPAAAGVTVRLADWEDVPAVAVIMAESWRFHAAHQPAIQITPWLPEQCHQQAQQLIGDGYNSALLVAESGGEVIGFFGVALNYQDPAFRPAFFERGRYGDILEVAVRGDQRRRGVGAAMFRAAWQWFVERDVMAMFVNYAPTNPVSSRFWPKLGFVDAWVSWWWNGEH